MNNRLVEYKSFGKKVENLTNPVVVLEDSTYAICTSFKFNGQFATSRYDFYGNATAVFDSCCLQNPCNGRSKGKNK